MFDEKLLNIFIAITWIWGAIILGLTLSPLVSQLYDIKTFSWSYSLDNPINWPPVELAIAVSQVSLGGVFYLLIILKLIIIAIIITIYLALGNAYWNFLYNYVHDPHLAGFIGNMILIIQNGMNPFLYLTMSKTVRSSFDHFLGFKKKPFITKTVPPKKVPIIKNSSE